MSERLASLRCTVRSRRQKCEARGVQTEHRLESVRVIGHVLIGVHELLEIRTQPECLVLRAEDCRVVEQCLVQRQRARRANRPPRTPGQPPPAAAVRQ